MPSPAGARPLLLAFVFLLALVASRCDVRADCVTNQSSIVDLSSWSVYQYDVFNQGNASWTLAQGNTVALQSVNADASILLSPFALTNEQIQGRWLVNTNDDDDFIGFVFGFQDDQHFYLFDWKQLDQNTTSWGNSLRGMSVKVLAASTPLTDKDLGTTFPTNASRGRLLYHNNIPWQDYTDYDFDLRFQPGFFTITVSQGTTILDTISIADTTYTSGKFGFYNFSQSQVQYSGFTRRVIPPQPIITVADAAVVEGNSGATSLVFSVNLSVTNCEPTLVDYFISPGSATTGVDYSASAAGTLVFAPGETNRLITVTVIGDRLQELNETLFLTLTNVFSGGIGRGLAVGTIINDDTNQAPICLVIPSAQFTVNVGTAVEFTIFSGDPDEGDTITLAVSGLPVGAMMSPALPASGADGVSSTFTWTPGGGQAGSHTVRFTVTDLYGSQSFCDVSVLVLPVADLALNMTATPSRLGLNGVITWSMNISNLGPSTSANVVLTDTLPAGLSNVNFLASQGGCTLAGNTLNCALGSLPTGTVATVTLTANAAVKGLLSSTASVSGGAMDPVSSNNSAAASVFVTNSPPVVSLVTPADGAQLPSPPGLVPIQAAASDGDGWVGRVDFYANGVFIGASTNGSWQLPWVANTLGPYTLLAVATDNDGARGTSAPVHIIIRPCSPALSATPLTSQVRCVCDEVIFSTTVTGDDPATCVWRLNGVVLPGQTSTTLRLQDLHMAQAGTYTVEIRTACASLTNNATLTLKGAGNKNPVPFANTNGFVISDSCSPKPCLAALYPTTILVECLPGPIQHISVTIDGINHLFPDDLDVLLVGPGGQTVKLMSDCGGGVDLVNTVLTFSDTATTPLPDGSPLTSGTYRPTDFQVGDTFPAPAPGGTPGTNFTSFLGTEANGLWSLYIVDDTGGDAGTILRGWWMNIEWHDTLPELTLPALLPDGRFQTTLSGLPRMTHVLEASANLQDWWPVSTNTLGGPLLITLDPPPAGPPWRFFRAVRCP